MSYVASSNPEDVVSSGSSDNLRAQYSVVILTISIPALVLKLFMRDKQKVSALR